MIVRWENSAEIEHDIGSTDFETITADILQAHRHGRHLVVLGRDLVPRLRKLGLSNADHALLERLKGEYSQTGALHRSAPIYIEVINSLGEGFVQEGQAFKITLGSIRKTRVLDMPILLSENAARDGGIYEMLLRYAAVRSGKGQINLDRAHGGGEDTPSVLADLINQKRAVFTIVDSDKDSPFTVNNNKLAKIEKLVGASDWPLALAGSPPCREVENLLPTDVLLGVDSAHDNRLLSLVIAIQDSEDLNNCPLHERFGLYVDLKKGLSSGRLSKMSDTDRAWIVAKLASALPDGTEWNLPGLGDRVIHQLLAEGKHIGRFHESIREGRWTRAFMAFFEEVAWFFISSRKLIT